MFFCFLAELKTGVEAMREVEESITSQTTLSPSWNQTDSDELYSGFAQEAQPEP